MRSGRRYVAYCLALLLAFGLLQVPTHAEGEAFYFPATGHNLRDSALLGFWQAHDGARLLGFPVTEASSVDNVTTQYFERGRLEARIDAATNAVSVQTGAVGMEYAALLGRRFAPAMVARAGGQQLGETAGHTVREPFLSFWQAAGGAAFFGAPISESLWEATENGQRRVQYFERARLEQDATMAGTPNEIVVSKLGLALIQMQQISTAPAANLGGDVYGPNAAAAANVVSLDATPTPLPTAVPPPTIVPAPRATFAPRPVATGAKPAPVAKPAAKPAVRQRQAASVSVAGKYILVNLSEQWMYAFEDGEQVLAAPISSGRDGMQTPTGTFAIYAKLKSQTMSGVLDGVPWRVPNIPNVMYITGGVALHGTYWHNAFGTGRRLSHGCVNMPLGAAAWLYNWAPMGTPVRVTY